MQCKNYNGSFGFYDDVNLSIKTKTLYKYVLIIHKTYIRSPKPTNFIKPYFYTTRWVGMCILV